MSLSIKHATLSANGDDPSDPTVLGETAWNQDHLFVVPGLGLVGRSSAGAGAPDLISVGGGLVLQGGALGIGQLSIGMFNSGTGASNNTFWRGDGTWVAVPSAVVADPTAVIGLTTIVGSSTNAMRSDAAPALSQAIVPTWTGFHIFSAGAKALTSLSAGNPVFTAEASGAATNPSTVAQIKYNLSALASGDMVVYASGHATAPFGQVSTDTGLTGGLNLVASAGQLLAQSTAAAVKIAGATGINFESPVGTAVGSYNGTVWGFLKPLSLTGILGNQITATSTNDGGTNSVIVGNGGTLANLNTVALLRASITSTANATMDLLVNGAASTPFGQLISGTALTGGLKINAGAGPITLTAANVSVPGTMSIGGAATHTEIVAPGTPSAGFVVLWADSTSANITAKNPAGTILAMVTPAAGAAHQFATAISAAGAISYAQPAFTDISGTLGSGQFGPLTGEVTTSGYAATITKSITPTWTGLHTFSAGLTATAASGSAPIVNINNLGSAASAANIAELQWALTAGSNTNAVAYVQGGGSPIFQINSGSGLTGGLNIVSTVGQATFQSLTGVVNLIGQTGFSIQCPTGTAVLSYNPSGSVGFSAPIQINGVLGSQFLGSSVNTGGTNSLVIANGGTATNTATKASIEVVLTSLAASNFIMSVSGAASNPFGLLETDTGLSGGLKIVADAGPVTLTGSQINTSKINTTGDITFSGNIHMPVTNLGGTTGVIFMGAQQFILVPTNNLFIGPAAGNLTLTEFENLGIGGGCLLHLTSGGQNTAINQLALAAMTTGSFNIGVGYNTMPSETTGSTNTAIGTEALLLQNGASNNVAVGFLAGQNITTGSNNVFVGTSAGGGITTGSHNTILGVISGLSATLSNALVIADGGNNILLDYNNTKANAWTFGESIGGAVDITLVGTSFTIRNNGQTQITNVGTNNFFAGHAAGNITNTGSGLSGFGNLTLNSIIDGTGNTAVGYVSSFGLTHGLNNTSIGASSLQSETTGNSNVALGANTLQNQNGAGGNTAVGINAGINITTGGANVFLGENAGTGITTGHSNTILGANAGGGFSAGTTGVIAISDGDGNIWVDFNLTTAATWTFLGAMKFGTINTLNIPNTTSVSVGTITQAGASLISTYNNNLFVGITAGNFTLTGTGNNSMGTAAHASLTTGSNNVTQGNGSSTNMTTGSGNTSLGTSAMTAATTGNNNVAVGSFALSNMIGGSTNVGIGFQAGLNLTTGTSNTFLGNGTGQGITTGSQNTIVGANVFGLSAGLSNAIIIADGGTNVRIDYNFTTANVLTLLGTCAKFTLTGGLQMGAPTGGDKGAGTINVSSGIFLNNTAYTNPDYVLEHFFRSEIVIFAEPQKGGSAWGNQRRRTYPGLMPLNELRDYVATNLRLPGIPDDPADIFERADMALEKIEEQAIYIVQLHERIAALEARLH